MENIITMTHLNQIVIIEKMLSDEDWQEIADAVGEDLLIIGNRVYTKTKFEEECKSFAPSIVIKTES